MVEGASWFGAALLPQGLDTLLPLTEKKYSQVYQDILQENAICPPIEAQQKLGDATGQRPRTQK